MQHQISYYIQKSYGFPVSAFKQAYDFFLARIIKSNSRMFIFETKKFFYADKTCIFTAVSLAYPLQNAIVSLAVGVGVGIGSAISIHLGSGNQEKADRAATVIGQICAFLLYIIVYKKRTFAVHIQPRHLIWDKQIIIQIYSVGIPSSIMMLLPSVLISMLNRILSLFDADTELMKAGITALRIISLGFLISTIGVIYSGVFEARGNGRNSLLISLLRQFAVTLPVSFILTAFLGPAGVWISFPIGEFTASAAAFLLLKYYKKGTFHPFQDKKVPFVHAIQIHNLRNTDVQVLHLLRLLPLS